LHIHHNKPGVMRQINRIFAELEINIAGQYLQTDSEIGYVVMDIDTDQADAVLERMKEIPETIRCRVLH